MDWRDDQGRWGDGEPDGDLSSAWAGLWPPRAGPGSQPLALPPDRTLDAATSTPTFDDLREVETRLERRIAEMVNMMETWQADMSALRSALATTVTEHVEARAAGLERDAAREAAHTAMTTRVDDLDELVRGLIGHVARLRSQLISTGASGDGALTPAQAAAVSSAGGDLRTVHAAVAAAQESIRELRRRMRTSLTPPAPTALPSIGDDAARAATQADAQAPDGDSSDRERSTPARPSADAGLPLG